MAITGSKNVGRIADSLKILASALIIPVLILTAVAPLPEKLAKGLLRDPASSVYHEAVCCGPLLGAVSNFGVVLWTVTAGALLMAAFIMASSKKRNDHARFLAGAGLLTGWLALDDLYMLHDSLLPMLGAPEKAVYAAYALATGTFFYLFRNLLRRERLLILAAAGGFFAVSILLDIIMEDAARAYYYEDAAKLFGIAAWAAFWLSAAAARFAPANISSSGADAPAPSPPA